MGSDTWRVYPGRPRGCPDAYDRYQDADRPDQPHPAEGVTALRNESDGGGSIPYRVES